MTRRGGFKTRPANSGVFLLHEFSLKSIKISKISFLTNSQAYAMLYHINIVIRR